MKRTANNISLRERKAAKTKLGIIKVISDMLKEKPLAEISVKETCEMMMISEGTFYNYFPKKADLLTYFIQLWAIDITWYADQKYGNTSGLKRIEAFFELTARQSQDNIFIMREIIALMALSREDLHFPTISLAEKTLAYPDRNGIELIEPLMLNDLFGYNIGLAVQLSELPTDTNIGMAAISVASIFFGVALILLQYRPDMLESTYQGNLEQLWKSLKVKI